jgi:intracellular multiplication protein IcmS
MSDSVKKYVVKFVENLNVNFTLHDRSITHEEVFNELGLMPAIARRADQLCSLCLGYGIGVAFEEAEKSVLGLKVTFDEVTPNALRLLCLIDVVSELIKAARSSSAVALDELMYD